MMEGEIVNKVANSALKVFDLEDYYPDEPRMELDISQWLFHGIVLKEKDFRAYLKEFDWSVYKDTYVAIHCSTDAILPSWAFMLVSSYLQPIVKDIYLGDLHHLEASIYQDILSKLDFSEYLNLPVIIKGCAKKPIPEEAYVLATQKLMPFARSIMFGEACSAVPIFKNKS